MFSITPILSNMVFTALLTDAFRGRDAGCLPGAEFITLRLEAGTNVVNRRDG